MIDPKPIKKEIPDVLHAIRKAPLIVPSPEMRRRLLDAMARIEKTGYEFQANYEAIKPMAFKLVPTRSYVKYIIKKQGKLKLPRKLKKAFKHIYLPPISRSETKIVRGARYIGTKILLRGYEIKPGYPHTKWTRKAMSFLKFKFEAI